MKTSRGMGQALWVWWKIFFVLFAGIGLVLSVFFPINSLWELLMGAAGVTLLALAADLLCCFVIFKAIFRKSRGRLEEYTEIITREGVGSEAHDFAQREYDRCRAAKKSRNGDDPEYWAIELAQAKLAMGDAGGAADILRGTDMSLYIKNAAYEPFQITLFKYYSLLVSADMSLGDREAADDDYSSAKDLLRNISKDSSIYPRTVILRGSYLIFTERFSEAEDMLEKLSSSERDVVLTKYMLLAELHSAMGDTSRASDEYDKALGLCPPEEVRKKIVLAKEKLMSNN